MRKISYDITFVVQFLTFYIIEPKNVSLFRCQYRAGAGIKEKVEPELEPKLNNFGSATLQYRYTVLRLSHVTEK